MATPQINGVLYIHEYSRKLTSLNLIPSINIDERMLSDVPMADVSI